MKPSAAGDRQHYLARRAQLEEAAHAVRERLETNEGLRTALTDADKRRMVREQARWHWTGAAPPNGTSTTKVMAAKEANTPPKTGPAIRVLQILTAVVVPVAVVLFVVVPVLRWLAVVALGLGDAFVAALTAFGL